MALLSQFRVLWIVCRAVCRLGFLEDAVARVCWAFSDCMYGSFQCIYSFYERMYVRLL